MTNLSVQKRKEYEKLGALELHNYAHKEKTKKCQVYIEKTYYSIYLSEYYSQGTPTVTGSSYRHCTL